MNNAERINELYTKYKLTPEDYFKHKHYTIITRSGIDKIQAAGNISVTYEIQQLSEDHKRCVVQAFGCMSATADSEPDTFIQSFGEAAPENNKNAYPVAMAEKRAMSRVVLKLAGFYEVGAFGEDEADDFKKKESKSTVKPTKVTLTDEHPRWAEFIDGLKGGSVDYDDLVKEFNIEPYEATILMDAAGV